MTLTTNGKKYIARHFGKDNCFVSSGVSYTDPNGNDATGGTADIVSTLKLDDGGNARGPGGEVYSDITAANGGSVTNTDIVWITDNDGSPQGEAQYCAPVEKGLVLHLKFDEGSGTKANDSSGYGNHATLYGGPSWVDGKIGKALQFDGVDDYVEAPGTGYSLESALTIAAWVKVDAYPDVQAVGIGQVGFNKQIFIKPDGRAGLNVQSDASPWLTFATADPLSKGVWYHIAGTFVQDGANMVGKLYINGVLENSKTVANTPHNTEGNKIRIGTTIHSFADYFKGIIDDVRIYNYALTDAEILTLYRLGEPTPIPTAGVFEFKATPSGTPTVDLDLTDLVMKQASDYHFEMNDITITNTSDWTVYLAMEVRLFSGSRDSCPTSGWAFQGLDRTATKNVRIKTLESGETATFDADFYQPSSIVGVHTVCLLIHGAWTRSELESEIETITE